MAAMTMPVVVREIPAWQLKTMGVEAEVLFRMPTIWSKQLSLGAVSWFSGILSASTFSFCQRKEDVSNGAYFIFVLGFLRVLDAMRMSVNGPQNIVLVKVYYNPGKGRKGSDGSFPHSASCQVL